MPSKRGRKTEYSPKLAILSRQGMTEKEIAKTMEISVGTLRNWCSEHVEFLIAIKEGKGVADAEVEAALYKRAMGYEVEELKVISVPNAAAKKGSKQGQKPTASITRIEKTTKHVAPDVTAQIFWLKNRKPEQWRDVKKTEVSGVVRTLADIITEAAAGEDSEL